MAEEVKNLPDVPGLEQFVAGAMNQDQVTDKTASEVAASQQQQVADDNIDLGQFKNPKDILKSYKEIQGFTTKVTQENKELKSALQQMQERMQMLEVAAQSVPQQPQAQQPVTPRDFDRMFVENPMGAIAQVADTIADQKLMLGKIETVLEEEASKNPQEFHERYNYAMQLKQRYPHLVHTSTGVRTLFKMADEVRKADMHRNASKALVSLLGEDADLDKFRQLIKKDQNNSGVQTPSGKIDHAFMPDSTGGIRTGADAAIKRNATIEDHVAKGDVDSVVKGIFSSILDKT